MTKYLLQKRQSGQDAHGDRFSWREGDILLRAHSEEVAKGFVALMHGAQIYSGEVLELHYAGPCETEMESTSMRDLMRSYMWGLGSEIDREDFAEFNRRWNDLGADSAIRFFLERKAPELIDAVLA